MTHLDIRRAFVLALCFIALYGAMVEHAPPPWSLVSAIGICWLLEIIGLHGHLSRAQRAWLRRLARLGFRAGNRCSGDCCRVIRIPVSPEELRTGIDASNGRAIDEAALLYSILKPTGRDKEAGRWLYKCVKLNRSGGCTIYDKRPAMCSDYPYGRACTYDRCTWTGSGMLSANRYPDAGEGLVPTACDVSGDDD